jgi:hypothetical protein
MTPRVEGMGRRAEEAKKEEDASDSVASFEDSSDESSDVDGSKKRENRPLHHCTASRIG